MGNIEIVKQMIDMYKKSFDDCFSTMSMIQDQTGKFLKTLAGNYPGMTDESKKVMEAWLDIYKKNRDDFKKAIDEGYAKLELLPDLNAIVMFREHIEKTLNTFLNFQKWMPQDFRKSMEEMVTLYEKSFGEFKKNIDNHIRQTEKPSSPSDEAKTKVNK